MCTFYHYLRRIVWISLRYEQQSRPINWGVHIVPEKKAYVVERFGKYHRILDFGIHILVSFVDRIVDVHSLADKTILIYQSAITKDYVPIQFNGVLYVKIYLILLLSGEAEATLNRSKAITQSLEIVSQTINAQGGAEVYRLPAPPRDGRSLSISELSELERMVGGMPDPSFVNQLLQNLAIMRIMQSLLSNPHNMSQNPELIRQLTSSETLQVDAFAML
ncbi:hypothetical protein ZIOFF_052187 [Zingiber officinale]|uniref:Band 7 domain-containing protein n=1 Tax=Zingiber officinale TaxID=94328 RepID=A0A8J5KV81_ZINOF|nr:hypothetical protein ZIOFF_052187 [Zingiber officinale]